MLKCKVFTAKKPDELQHSVQKFLDELGPDVEVHAVSQCEIYVPSEGNAITLTMVYG